MAVAGPMSRRSNTRRLRTAIAAMRINGPTIRRQRVLTRLLRIQLLHTIIPRPTAATQPLRIRLRRAHIQRPHPAAAILRHRTVPIPRRHQATVPTAVAEAVATVEVVAIEVAVEAAVAAITEAEAFRFRTVTADFLKIQSKHRPVPAQEWADGLSGRNHHPQLFVVPSVK